MKFFRKIGCLGWGLIFIVLTPFLIHLAFFRLPPYLRKPTELHLKFVDSSGEPISGVEIETHEWGRRGLLPIPFSHSWIVEFSPEKTVSDQNGELIVRFRQDSLELDSMEINDAAISEFTATYHRQDGEDFVSENHINERYGHYHIGLEPYRRYFTVLVPSQDKN